MGCKWNSPLCNAMTSFAIKMLIAKRLQDWQICVPSPLLQKGKELIQANADRYLPFAPKILNNPAEPICKYPRFKLTGLQLFFLLVPSEAVHFSFDEPDCIVRGKTGLPLPALKPFVQSLLDSNNLVDLEDAVDGMDIQEEWAAEVNLKLTNHQREWWERIARTKQSRMGGKFDTKYYATRYRYHGDRDPTEDSWL
jgi:hypothetical protein